MAFARVVEVDYYEFSAALRKAVDAGTRVEPSDKAAWKQFIKGRNIKDASLMSLARNQFEGVALVGIDDDSDWGGCYAYSKMEEACLKWVPGD